MDLHIPVQLGHRRGARLELPRAKIAKRSAGVLAGNPAVDLIQKGLLGDQRRLPFQSWKLSVFSRRRQNASGSMCSHSSVGAPGSVFVCFRHSVASIVRDC